MLSFIKLSERRFLVVNVPINPDSWQRAAVAGKGFMSSRAEMITTKPVPWGEAVEIAGRWANERGLLITNEEWTTIRRSYESVRSSLQRRG